MSGVCWWLTDILSRLLDAGERDAVRGDLQEARTSAGRAFADVLGLILRRQAGAWSDWRPWAALVSLVVPIGLLLGLNSVWIGRSYDLYWWILRNYGSIDPSTLHQSNLELGAGVWRLLRYSLLLSAWSWSAGFVVGAWSRRAIAVNGAVFCLLMVVGERWGAPAAHYYVAGTAFAKRISLVAWPVILLAVLVLAPALRGMAAGRRRVTLRLPHAAILAAMIAGLTALAPTALWWWNWPAAYILLDAARRGRRVNVSA